MLGSEAYDNARMILAEIKTIRRYTEYQIGNNSNDPKTRSYREYLSFRDKYLPLDRCEFFESLKDKNNNPNSIRNIRINRPNPSTHSRESASTHKKSNSTSSHRESKSISN